MKMKLTCRKIIDILSHSVIQTLLIAHLVKFLLSFFPRGTSSLSNNSPEESSHSPPTGLPLDLHVLTVTLQDKKDAINTGEYWGIL